MIIYALLTLSFFVLLALANSLYIKGLHGALDYENIQVILKYRATVHQGAGYIVLNGKQENILESKEGELSVFTADYPEVKFHKLRKSIIKWEIISIKEIVNLKQSNILYPIKKWFLRTIGDWWSKPFVGCIYCMSSIHSTYIFFPVLAALQCDIWAYFAYPLYIALTSGISYLIYK